MSSNHGTPMVAGPHAGPPCRDRARAAQTCDEATFLLDGMLTIESVFSAVSPGTARSARTTRLHPELCRDISCHCPICFTFGNVASAA